MKKRDHSQCTGDLLPIRDALDVLSGKWKLQIVIAISAGNTRFREIERAVTGITSKVLTKELKDLEEHQLIKRSVYTGTPVLVEYTLSEYAESLEPVIRALSAWGKGHRKRLMQPTPLDLN
ncbi:transcriptional regulator [Siphonobacter sp. BAB-5385]|uniref:winged helix-turn-helix transcriptional regulator n=1 Tax=unclassified Siphonobacter TaxID=2635712 RepID=UPI000B9E4086|nr:MULTISPECIES: helix-turn-helix domain-containing protein [unclassified Siphonobacter]OZI05731.1 transcriptional regulator [Siphonobacter sp. BAB-5385]PMD87111.1 transcriptional regulator [Siphonobacter sp. BAB-5405]